MAHALDTTKELVRQVRGGTRSLLAAAPPESLLWAPAGTANHIVWHAGHALWLQDALIVDPITGSGELPTGWADVFGMDCRPVRLTGNWPTRDELDALLYRQLERMLTLFEELPPRRAAMLAGQERKSLLGQALHGLHDEARHQGEMYLLLKLWRTHSRGIEPALAGG